MADVIQLFPTVEQCSTVQGGEHNPQTENVGPPVGSFALSCCGDFAFYVTTEDIRCYFCHKPQVF